MRLTRKQAEDLGLDKAKSQKKRPKVYKDKTANPLFDALCASHGLPRPVPEFEFAKDIGRDWRFDFLFDGWLALEKQGGNWQGGRHTRAAALEKEYEKLNHAVLMGYSVLFATPAQIKSGEIFPFVKMCLEAREEQA